MRSRGGLAEALEATRLLLEAVSSGEYCCLRHGLPYVTPSLLAEQAFCERRLEHRLAEGGEKEPPASPVQARKLLEALLGARRRLWTGEEKVITAPLAALVEDVPLIGRPPALALDEGCVRAVYLVKVTSRPRLYHSDRVKAYAYATLVERAGIACSDMKIAYVTTPEPIDLKELLALLPDPTRPRPVKGEHVSVHILAHDPRMEMELLAPLLAYWRGERSATPRPGPWCRTCPYQRLCPAAAGHP